MKQFAFTLSIGAMLLLTQPAQALEGCKAQMDKNTGTILVNAKGVAGTLYWGGSAGTETNLFANAAQCVVNGAAKKCVLGNEGTAARITPPSACTIYLKDDTATDSCSVKGCVAGLRTQADVADALCGELGFGPGCNLKRIVGKLVFITASVHTGNLGGLAGADQICQTEAANAGLVGVFKAWLSADGNAARNRIPHSSSPYYLVNGTKIADNTGDLYQLDAPIDRGPDGSFIQGYAWTSTDTGGNDFDGDFDCGQWASAAAHNFGVTGWNQLNIDDIWTRNTYEECNEAYHLYCFQL